MSKERWQLVERIYHAALEREGEARAAFLTEACADDRDLRREVEALITERGQAGSFIESPTLEIAAKQMPGDSLSQAKSSAPDHIGPYKLLAQLGRGGMGEVHRALDTRLHREVAIKFLPPETIGDDRAKSRLIREARAAARLDHPNICGVYEVGEEEGRRFIAMQYIDGETLAGRIERKSLNLRESLDIAEQVADALAEAHSHQIIHRDIKPQNIMLTARGQVKVMDFGLARVLHTNRLLESSAETESLLTEPGTIVGTAAYMSPEQINGQPPDARSDIFSLGAVVYEMVSGRRLFVGESTGAILSAVLTCEPAPLARYATDVPPELERIVKKCLDKNRERRYQTMRDVATDLYNLRRSSELPQTSAQAIDPVTRGAVAKGAYPVSRRRTPARLPTLIVLGLVVLAVAGWLIYALLSGGTPAAEQRRVTSLAVLPLENLSGDPEQEYFADGMTESLITELAKIGALRVISRTSMMQYKGARRPLAEIARALNVDALIEGSVQRVSGRVRITAKLIRGATGQHLWAESYDRDLRDAQALQSEIAQAIIHEIQIELTRQEQMRLASARPVHPAAYDDYLRGRFYSNRQNKADNATAIEMLERAVATDPTFAAANAELAQAYVWRSFLFTPEAKKLEEKAFVALEKSLALDPDLAVAYLARGNFLWTSANHFPHEKAIQEYRRALALNPNLDEARNQLALVYNHIGAFDQALQELQKALMINPTNTSAQFRIGQTLLFQGKYEEALTALRSIPREANPRVGHFIAMALLHLDRRDEAAAIVEEFLTDHPEDTDGGLLTSVQAMLAALAGEENKAEDKIRSAIEKGKGLGHFHHTAYNIGCVYSAMKKAEPAIKWLQAAADGGFPCYPLFENDRYLDNLREDPRFIALIAKLKGQWEHYRTIV